LPRTIGSAAALEILMSGRWIDAKEAQKLKLVNRVLPRSDLLPAAEELARKIMSFPQPAVLNIKQAVWCGLDLPLSEGLALEARLGKRLNP
jgi:enoyl-CoA hydratase/carnithine racemase